MRLGRFVRELLGVDFISEDLLVTHDPRSEEHHQQGSPLEQRNRGFVQPLVVDRRLLIVVRNQKLLNEVVVEESERGVGEQDGKSEAVHESHIDATQNTGVLEMHQMLGATVEVDELLLANLLRVVLLLAAPDATVEASEKQLHAITDGKVHVDVDRVDLHRVDEGRGNRIVPVLGQVSVTTVQWQEGEDSFTQVGIRQQQQNSCVEECSNEDTSHDSLDLLGLSVVANDANQPDVDFSDHDVETDDEVGDSLSEEETIEVLLQPL